MKYERDDFRIECAKNYVVIILTIKKSRSRIIDSNNREYIIFDKVMNAVNNIISSFFVFKRLFIVYCLTVNDFH